MSRKPRRTKPRLKPRKRLKKTVKCLENLRIVSPTGISRNRKPRVSWSSPRPSRSPPHLHPPQPQHPHLPSLLSLPRTRRQKNNGKEFICTDQKGASDAPFFSSIGPRMPVKLRSSAK